MLKNLCASVTLLVSSVALAATPSLELVAPDNTVIAIGVKNFKDARQRGSDHPLMTLWTAGEQAAGTSPLLDLLPEGMHDLFDAAANGDERLPVLVGAVGIALFSATKKDVLMPIPAVLMMADYGQHAEAIEQRLAAVIERGTESGAFTASTSRVGDVTFHSIKLPASPPGEEPNDFDDLNLDAMENDGGLGMFLPDPADFLGEIDELHFVRSGTVVLGGTDRRSLEQGVTALGGGEASVLVGSRAFRGVRKQLGDLDAYTVVMTGNMMPLVASVDPMGMSMMITPMLRAAFGDIQGFGYGVDLGAANDSGRQQLSIYMPNGKQGLPALMDTAGPRGEMPAFVGADTVAYTTMNFDFNEAVPFIDRFIQANPMLMMQAGQSWQEMRRTLDPIFSKLGSRMHMVGGASNQADGSNNGLIAVEYADAAAFKSAFATMAEGYGMVPKQFDGHAIYSAAADQIVPPMGIGPDLGGAEGSIGLGDTHVFMGTDQAVRAALTSEPAAGGAASPLMRHVMETLPADGLVGWGFADVGAAMDVIGGPAGLDAASDDAGPAVWSLRSTDDGFICTILQLAPILSVQVE